MAARAGEAFIAVGPNFKGWRAKQEAFVKSNLKAIQVPAELDFGNKPIVAPPIKDPVVKPRVDESRFRRGLGVLENRLDRLTRGRFLVNVGIAAAPLAAPIAGVAAGGLLAGAGIGTAGLAGVGAFAGVGKRSLDNIADKQAAGQSLTSGESAVASARKSASGMLDTLAADPKILGALAAGFTVLGKAVTPLGAFLRPVSTALQSVFTQFGNAAASGGFKTFAADFGAFSGTILRDAGAGIMNLGRAFGNLLSAFAPLSKDMSKGLVGMTKDFATWTAGLSKSKGFQSFVEYVRTNGPLLISTIGKVGLALIAIGTAVAPLGAKLLQVVGAAAPMIANFAQAHPLLIQTAVGILSASAALAAFAKPAAMIISLVRITITVLRALWLVLAANPIGIVIAIIALLVVGFIQAYRKSETFRSIVDGAMRGVAGAFTFLWDQVQKVFGWIKDGWNSLVELFSKPLQPKVSPADPKAGGAYGGRVGGVSGQVRPKGNAMGTNSWTGGLTWVGERGPELAWLPRGTAITPNNRIGDLRATAGAFQIPVGRSKSMKVGDLRGSAASLGGSGAPTRMRIVNFDYMKDYIDLVADGQISDERDFAGMTRRMGL